MVKYFMSLVLVLFAARLWGQNLVPNPSFENYKNLPCSWNVVAADFPDYVSDWYIPANTSSDIHSTIVDPGCWCNTSQPGDENNCKVGTQLPHTGNVMAGLYTYVNTHIWHEYIQIKLKQPLEPGKRYCIQMWVSAADHATQASNNIGMLFTVDPVEGENQILAKPQINQTEVVKNVGEWTIVTGSFVADAQHQYLTIGNFFSDEETKTEPIDSRNCTDGAYFFIDDISVMLCPI
jgi:hypothetical protein